MCNQVKLSGFITKIYPSRYTPSGVEIARFVLDHSSEQEEDNVKCRIRCRMFCIWVNPEQKLLEQDSNVTVSGFISQNAKLKLVLHIKEFLQIPVLDKGN